MFNFKLIQMVKLGVIIFSGGYEWKKIRFIKIFMEFAKSVLILRVPNELIVIAKEFSKK